MVRAPEASSDSTVHDHAEQSPGLAAVEAGPQEDRNSFVRAGVKNPKDTVSDLKKVAHDLRQQKVRLTKDLKNARRRNSRMKNRAKTLTDDELWSVLRMRSATRDERLMRARNRGTESSVHTATPQVGGASASASDAGPHARLGASEAALPPVLEDDVYQPASDRPGSACDRGHAMFICLDLENGGDLPNPPQWHKPPIQNN